jgi:hypothetical protein
MLPGPAEACSRWIDVRGSFCSSCHDIEPDLIRALKELALPMVSERWDRRASMKPCAPLTPEGSPGPRDCGSPRELCDRGAEGAA